MDWLGAFLAAITLQAAIIHKFKPQNLLNNTSNLTHHLDFWKKVCFGIEFTWMRASSPGIRHGSWRRWWCRSLLRWSRKMVASVCDGKCPHCWRMQSEYRNAQQCRPLALPRFPRPYVMRYALSVIAAVFDRWICIAAFQMCSWKWQGKGLRSKLGLWALRQTVSSAEWGLTTSNVHQILQ